MINANLFIVEFDRLFKISFSFGLELVIDKRLEDEYSKLMQTNNMNKLSKNKDVEGTSLYQSTNWKYI